MALTKLTKNLIDGNFGTEWVSAIQTSNFTAAAGKGYFVNTTSQVLYVTLPVGVVGTEIVIQDYAGTFATNKVILIANGSENIQGSTINGRIETKNATATLVYQDATQGWTSQDVTLDATTISWATPTGQSLTYSTPSPIKSVGSPSSTFPTTTFTATKSGSTLSGTASISGLPSSITASQSFSSGLGNILTVTLTGNYPASDSLNTNLTLSGLSIYTPPVSIHFLVIGAGGGGNKNNGGGAGAGGLRTSWAGGSGGGGSSESQVSLTPGTNYTVTVGAGGTAGTGSDPYYGTKGSDSVFASITSIGGGYGGVRTSEAAKAGGPGGSGGGGGSISVGGNQPGSGTANQGYAGGTGADGGNYRGGGGGGASAVGASAGSGGGGGGGKAVLITGSSVTYAGGGGAGANSGAPGSAGGGGGAGSTSTTMNSGTANTGGGAGSGAQAGTISGGVGGSGIVILRYPNTKTITNPGAGLTFTTDASISGVKITKFTAGTGNIQFN